MSRYRFVAAEKTAAHAASRACAVLKVSRSATTSGPVSSPLPGSGRMQSWASASPVSTGRAVAPTVRHEFITSSDGRGSPVVASGWRG